jgi:hypothetical protein
MMRQEHDLDLLVFAPQKRVIQKKNERAQYFSKLLTQQGVP